MNNTKPNSVQLIKKPVLVVMGLLSKLGDQLVHVEDLKKTFMTDIGILATTESTEAGYVHVFRSSHYSYLFLKDQSDSYPSMKRKASLVVGRINFKRGFCEDFLGETDRNLENISPKGYGNIQHYKIT